jgi:hypothetical protein
VQQDLQDCPEHQVLTEELEVLVQLAPAVHLVPQEHQDWLAALEYQVLLDLLDQQDHQGQWEHLVSQV